VGRHLPHGHVRWIGGGGFTLCEYGMRANRGEQCGCVTGTTNPAPHTFTSVTGGKLKPMKACDADKKLMQAFNARNH